MVPSSRSLTAEGSSRMKDESLDELRRAFEGWRRTKKHVREPVPGNLLARARRCTKRYGVAEVVRATRLERARLFRVRAGDREGHRRPEAEKNERVDAPAPAFSRLELSAQPGRAEPIAEVAVGSGVTLRMFRQTPEMVGLLRMLCGSGGER